jgi:hypothetical protein
VVAEEPEPVGFVASLGLGEGKEDVPFLAAAVLGEVAVDAGLGAFVGEVLAPPLNVGRAGAGPCGSGCCGSCCGGFGDACCRLVGGKGMAAVRFSVLRHEHSWA